MAQQGPPRTGLTHKASITDLVKDLELLRVDTKDYGETMDSMGRALDLRIEELKTNNGTLLEGYNKIVKDLKQTHKQRHALKDCYSKIKKVLSNTQGISLQEEADFRNRAEKMQQGSQKQEIHSSRSWRDQRGEKQPDKPITK
ncbi:unnamed protein product [Porites lobata]|uniref:Uncharacterized protein n=1 Tax=Porites lobata TaxID=104759 RepID=A0ABN8RXJ8_9CNID|nr:unnamed protein product [Porites lobata]